MCTQNLGGDLHPMLEALICPVLDDTCFGGDTNGNIIQLE
jgi:hypothetical protein